MEISEQQIQTFIRKGEGLDLEFKTCREHINRDVYKTVCAFLNRHGGTILLGVLDSGEINGISPSAINRIKKDFISAINNPQKISPPCYLTVEEVLVSGKALLYIFVPESSQVHRCNGRIFDRNEDGDLDITDHTAQVAQLYQRKQTVYSENKVFPHLSLEDLDRKLLASCRKIAVLRRDDHPWRHMDDMELVQSAQLYQKDPETGKMGITRAGILLLGKQLPLLQTVPHHRTDLIVRRKNIDRYDDRDFVDVNLVESYERIMAFIRKHLPDPFYLDGTTNISLRDAIFREVASNILIHREYTNAFPAKLIIEHGQVRTENSSRPHGFGRLDPENFTPFPKNPVIARFFRQIGRADELGSGMRNMMRYCNVYGGAPPELTEGDVFRITIQVPEIDKKNRRDSSPGHDQHDHGHVGHAGHARDHVPEHLAGLLAACDRDMTRQELMRAVGVKSRTTFSRKYLTPALNLKLLEMTTPEAPKSPRQRYRLTAAGRRSRK